jgi:hypothetical protein
MAYTGAVAVLNNSETALDRDELALTVYAETMEAFERANIGVDLIYNQTITSGKSAQFIVAGKADGTDVATHDAGTQVSVTDTPFSERTIVIGVPEYTAKRIDEYEEAMAHYDVRTPITRHMGQSLAIKLDKAIFTKVEAAAQASGVAGNADGYTVTNTAIAGATTIEAKGDAIMESIYAASATIRGNDYSDEIYCVVSPANYNALVLSKKLVNNDYTSGDNGGVDTGRVGMVGNVKVYESNNLPATANLEALVFGKEAVGMVTLIGLKTAQAVQEEFLGATLMTAKYAYGLDVLRPEVATRIMSA